MMKVLGHSDTLFEICEPKFPKKIDFLAKFRPKTVSRILSGMSLLKNLLSFYEELTYKGSYAIEILPNLYTFPEMV